jgi:hypothetical protein
MVDLDRDDAFRVNIEAPGYTKRASSDNIIGSPISLEIIRGATVK